MAISAPSSPQRLVFQDNFNSFVSSPDGSSGWMTAYPYGGEGARTLPNNHEAEYYSDSSVGRSPFSDRGGVLSITASAAPGGSNPYGLPYVSGLITTYKSFAMTYGVFSVRAELPAGKGLWPAFWLLPADNHYTSELDVFEQLGSAPGTIYVSTHGATGGTWHNLTQAVHGADSSAAFHTYSVDWEPKTTVFSIDGHVVAQAATPASMDQPMYMLLNLAVGGAGSWPGAAPASSLPSTMKIDWVAAYATANSRDISGAAAMTHGIVALGVSDWSAGGAVHPATHGGGAASGSAGTRLPGESLDLHAILALHHVGIAHG